MRPTPGNPDYEQGYSDGESSVSADVQTAIEEAGSFPDGTSLTAAMLRARRYREALRQIMGRAQAIPENPVGNEIEDLAREALEAPDEEEGTVGG